MIERIVRALLVAHGKTITLDQIGEAIGIQAVTPAQIEDIIYRLERAGRTVATPSGGDGEASLKRVLDAARELTNELGLRPTVAQISERAGLEESHVRHALSLAKVIAR